MAFKLQAAPEFDFEARITQPNNQYLPLRLRARYKGRKALNAWIASAGKPDAESGQVLDDVDYMMQVIVGWASDEQVSTPDGEPAPFTRASFEALLDEYPTAGNDIFRDYLRELTEARRGN